jgi:hypothetical protein
MHLFSPPAGGAGLFSLMMPKNSISDYKTTITNAQSPGYQVDGFVFVETGQTARAGNDIQTWAAGPLGELSFLKGVVEGTPSPGQVTISKDASLLKGIVAWAPIDRGLEAFQEYLKVAEKTAGKETWSRVKGFRYMLQGIRSEQKFKSFVEDPKVIKVLQAFGESYTFDVAVDQHHGGVWQLELVANFIETVSNSSKTRFILSTFSSLLHLPLLFFKAMRAITANVSKITFVSQTWSSYPQQTSRKKTLPDGSLQ